MGIHSLVGKLSTAPLARFKQWEEWCPFDKKHVCRSHLGSVVTAFNFLSAGCLAEVCKGPSTVGGTSATPLRTELSCEVPARFQLRKLDFELPGMEARAFTRHSVLQFTASLTQGHWPSGLKVSSHRCVYHLEGIEFPFLGGSSVSEGAALK